MAKPKYDRDKLRELFELCGYEDEEEMDKDISRLEAVMPRALITPEDVVNAIPRMKDLYREDLELKSLRKILGLWLKRFIALMHCRDEYKKVIYHIHPGEPRHCLMLNLTSEDIYCDFADSCVFMVQSQIFGNINRYLEIGEKHGLPPARAHCGINVFLTGVLAEDIIPKPDLLVIGPYQCDQSHKVTELLSEVHKVPFLKFDTISDEPWGFFPDISDVAVDYWAKTYDRFLKKTEEFLGMKITPEAIQETRHSYARMWRLLDELHKLIVEADPRPVSVAAMAPFEWMILEPERLTVQEGVPALELHIQEVKERIANGFGVMEKGAPKVMLKCGLGGDAFSIGRVMEESGVNPVIPLNATWLAPFEKVPLPEQFKNASLSERIAAAYLRKGYVRAADHHAYRIKEIVKQTGVDGVLFSYVYQCRCFAALPFIVKQTVESETGVPTMPLEVGAFDARDYSGGALKTRIETFGDLLRARKAAKAVEK